MEQIPNRQGFDIFDLLFLMNAIFCMKKKASNC